MDISPLCIHSSLVNCFNKVIFLRFYNELKFYILFRNGNALAITRYQNLNFLSHSTLVLSTIDKSLVTFMT